MKKNIYKDHEINQKNKRVVKQYVHYPVRVPLEKSEEVAEVKEAANTLIQRIEQLEKMVKGEVPIVEVNMPELQKVEVTNPPTIPEVHFPDVQEVKVNNLKEIEFPQIPKIQKVEVTNPSKPVEFPKVQKVEITNPQKPQLIPVGEGDIAGKADPEKYVPVRLTNGKRFYDALKDAFVGASKATAPYVNYNSGRPQQATVDNDGSVFVKPAPGITTAVSGSLSLTTTSGSPMYVSPVNFPTVQTVSVQNLPYVQVQPGITTAVSGSLSLTTTSGSPMNAAITNFPTVQTVNVQNLPNVTTLSGSKVDVSNFPTVQTVNVQNLPNVTTASGSIVDIKNFPTVQTVNVQNLPSVNVGSMPVVTNISGTVGLVADGTTTAVSGTMTTISGSKTDIQNFPTVQTVNVMNMPSVTTASGSQIDVKNFPTVQTVNVQNIPNITTSSGSQMDIKNFPTYQTVNVQNMPVVTTISGTVGNVNNGVTLAVSGTVTSISGSVVDIKNWPTVQTVNVQNLPSITTLSGSQVDVKNFPTIQTVQFGQGYAPNVQITPGITTAVSGSLSLTTTSGSPMYTYQTNIPTIQTVNVQNIPNITTASGSIVDVKNFPTYQGTRIYDAGGNMLGIQTSPLTVSGTVDLATNTSTTYSGIGTAIQTLKGSSGIFDGYYIYNPNSSVAYVQLFDTTGAVTLGTTNPDVTLGIPATSAANLSDVARLFNNGIKFGATTTAKGSVSPSTGLDMTLFYK